MQKFKRKNDILLFGMSDVYNSKIKSSLISIIVPVYKAELYLRRCVDSLLSQKNDNFEILLIDDGSPDKSGIICDEYACKDFRVHAYHKKNGGVSSARNYGLRKAKGEWIGFVDADDWVEDDFLSPLDEIDSSIEIVHFGMKKELKNKNIIFSRYFQKKEKIYACDVFSAKYFNSSSCSYFFSRKLLEGVYFNEDIKYSEDREFIVKVLLKSKKEVLLSTKCAYIYAYNEKSATNIIREDKHRFDDLETLKNIFYYSQNENLNYNDECKAFVYNLTMKNFFIGFYSISQNKKVLIKMASEQIKQINLLYNVFNKEVTIFLNFPYLILWKYKLYWNLRKLYYRFV